MPSTRPLALITGASSGLGATFARALAKRDYDLILVARRKELLEQLATEIRPATADIVVADLTNDADLHRVEQRIQNTPALNLLINNAGFGTKGFFATTDVESQDKMHRLHVIATMRLTHAALPAMVKRNAGAIINVSSVAGFGTGPGNVSYCATKAWMNFFTEGLALELRSSDSAVRVQSLCPGFTVTGFHDAMGVERQRIPRTLWMPAEEVVATSLAGLDRGALFVIPGWKNKFFVAVMRWLPRRVLQAANARMGRRMRRI